MRRRGLFVGIENYEWGPLPGCGDDAIKMSDALALHDNGDLNIEAKVLISRGEDQVTKPMLLEAIDKLFRGGGELALFYFSGHGYTKQGSDEGYINTVDSRKSDPGVPLDYLLAKANEYSDWEEVLIILDCCHAGSIVAEREEKNSLRYIRKGVAILAGSEIYEYSKLKKGSSVFTSKLVDGLNGEAADILGRITAASLYYYADQVLGAWDQRPLFITHVNGLTILKQSRAKLEKSVIRLITTYFETKESEFVLSPLYEDTVKGHDPKLAQIFKKLQKMTSAGLVEPVGEEHMYYAAMNSKSCRLTGMGKAYWEMVTKGRI